ASLILDKDLLMKEMQEALVAKNEERLRREVQETLGILAKDYATTEELNEFLAKLRERQAARIICRFAVSLFNKGDCFGYDSDHPPYEGEGYRCTKCRKVLTNIDD